MNLIWCGESFVLRCGGFLYLMLIFFFLFLFFFFFFFFFQLLELTVCRFPESVVAQLALY